MEEKKYSEDCIHVEYDADGPHCKIDACKGFQCRYRFGEDCGHYEPKTKKKQGKTKTSNQDYVKKDNFTVDMDNNPHQGDSIGTTPKASGRTSFGCSIENTATTLDMGGSTTINPPMSYGWVCPKCGRVNAPWKGTCDCCKGISLPYTPPNTPQTPAPYYNPPLEIPNPYDPYGPYKWGDAPGWWNKGPTCETLPKKGMLIMGIEYPDGHIEKCPQNYFSGLGNPIPCSPSAGDPNFGNPGTTSNKINSQDGGDPNISAWNK